MTCKTKNRTCKKKITHQRKSIKNTVFLLNYLFLAFCESGRSWLVPDPTGSWSRRQDKSGSDPRRTTQILTQLNFDLLRTSNPGIDPHPIFTKKSGSDSQKTPGSATLNQNYCISCNWILILNNYKISRTWDLVLFFYLFYHSSCKQKEYSFVRIVYSEKN